MRAILFIAAVFLLLASPARAETLDGNTIKATFFNGQPFTASTPARVRYTMVFTPDGKATREPTGKAGLKSEGKWRIVKEGYCTSWKGGKPTCYRVVSTGDNKWSVMSGATVIAYWTR
jgi:hypothetical protein